MSDYYSVLSTTPGETTGGVAALNVGTGLVSSGGNLNVDTTTIATKSYVDATVGGLLYKAACRAVAVTPVASLSGPQTIDTVSLIAGNRVLLTAQANAADNGPWIVQAGAWTRPLPNELQASAAFPISEGSATYADSIWYITTNDPISAGVTPIALARASFIIDLGSQVTGTLPIGNGGTGATTAPNARTALGVQDGVRLIPLCPNATSTSNTVDVVIGGTLFNPSDYAITGRTPTITLQVVGQVSAAGVTGTVTLYNVTDGANAATPISVTALSATYGSVSVAVPAAAKTFELRLKKSGGTTTDYVLVYGINLSVVWS